MKPHKRWTTIVCLLAGCSAEVSDGRGSRGDSADGRSPSASGGGRGGAPGAPDDGRAAAPGQPGATGAAAACKSPRAPSPGRSPLRRLTRVEYNNTVRDLLGDDSRPADRFPAEEVGNGFGNDADALGVSRLLVDGHYAAAEALAARAVRDAPALAKLVGCDAVARGEEACARAFVEGFGARAFRRPLDPSEVQDFVGTYGRARAGADFKAGIQAVLQVMLQAPQFLYRIEVGAPVPGTPGVAKLTPYETASRLSYLLTGSMPDDALTGAARAGKLGTREEVLGQAKRLLGTPAAREAVRVFHESLYETDAIVGVTKNAQALPAFVAGTGALLHEETDRFVDYVVWEGAGDLKTLLTARYTFMNAALAKFYGVANVRGDAFQRVELDEARRIGVATHASILAATSPGTRTNPVARGKFVRTRFLCSPVPPPPPDLNAVEPPPVANLTTRERFSQHSTDAACAGCHKLMDPIGFGLENYDAAGLWRATENGKPVDASGEIVGTGAAGPFVGPGELMRRIAGSPDAGACYVGKWMTFAFGRAEVEADACTRAELEAAFSASGGRVTDLVLALTQTDAFLYRTVAAR